MIFIGGPMDGKDIEVVGERYICAIHDNDNSAYYVHYNKCSLYGFNFMGLSKVSTKDLLEKVFKFYGQKRRILKDSKIMLDNAQTIRICQLSERGRSEDANESWNEINRIDKTLNEEFGHKG